MRAAHRQAAGYSATAAGVASDGHGHSIRRLLAGRRGRVISLPHTVLTLRLYADEGLKERALVHDNLFKTHVGEEGTSSNEGLALRPRQAAQVGEGVGQGRGRGLYWRHWVVIGSDGIPAPITTRAKRVG